MQILVSLGRRRFCGSDQTNTTNSIPNVIFATCFPYCRLRNTSPCPAWRISSSKTGRISSAVSATISHCVETGSGIRRFGEQHPSYVSVSPRSC